MQFSLLKQKQNPKNPKPNKQKPTNQPKIQPKSPTKQKPPKTQKNNNNKQNQNHQTLKTSEAKIQPKTSSVRILEASANLLTLRKAIKNRSVLVVPRHPIFT